MERRRALGGPLPRRVVRNQPLPAPAPAVDAEFAGRQRDAGLHDDGLRPSSCATSSATRSSAAGSCRSSRTRRARSAWTRCSRRSASTPPSASATSRSTPTSSSRTARPPTARSSRRASPRPARWPRSRRPARRTPPTACAMIPFYIFYSMFGFQRTGDQIWAFGDARGRGFLMGATAGRTTLTGEGLQHDDGHIAPARLDGPEPPRLRPGLRLRARRRSSATASSGCTSQAEDVFYYVTLYNENYAQPADAGRPPTRGSCAASTGSARRPDLGGARTRRPPRRLGLDPPAGPRGPRPARRAGSASRPRSTARRRSRSSAATRSRRERWNRLHPDASRRASRTSSQVLPPDGGPIIAATDWMKALPDMVGALAAGALRAARHRRLRPQRHARGPAGALRDRPAAHRGRHPGRARDYRCHRGRARGGRRSAISGSTRRRPTRSTSDAPSAPAAGGRAVRAPAPSYHLPERIGQVYLTM